MATYNEFNNLDVKTDLRFNGVSGSAGEFLGNTGWATPTSSQLITNIGSFTTGGAGPASTTPFTLATTQRSDPNYTLSANEININVAGTYRIRYGINIILSDTTTVYQLYANAGGSTMANPLLGPVPNAAQQVNFNGESIQTLALNDKVRLANSRTAGTGTWTISNAYISIEKLN